MNITIQSPATTLSFGGAGSEGSYASLSTVGSSVTSRGLRTQGAILLDGSSEVTKKGVVRTVLRVRVPLVDLGTSSDAAVVGSVSESVAGKPAAGFAQVAITATLPNRAGIVASSDDYIELAGTPTTQAAANASAINLAVQILANAILNQGDASHPVLVNGGSLFGDLLLGADVSDNPIARGLMGLTPISGANRAITAAAS